MYFFSEPHRNIGFIDYDEHFVFSFEDSDNLGIKIPTYSGYAQQTEKIIFSEPHRNIDFIDYDEHFVFSFEDSDNLGIKMLTHSGYAQQTEKIIFSEPHRNIGFIDFVESFEVIQRIDKKRHQDARI